tara:strand:- start:23 stop:1327 length:1305 start_codon:yes stop_codon:yes gene_type:complete
MITKEEYMNRRKRVADLLPTHAVAIIPAAREFLRNGDAHFRFRQDSDFYYLTGLNEPDALLVITSKPDCESFLFNLPKNAELEQWTGTRLGQEGAKERLGVTDAFSIDDCSAMLPDFLSNRSAVYTFLGRNSGWDEQIKQAWMRVKNLIRTGVKAPDAFHDLSPMMSEMRLFKSEQEIQLMKIAADVSVEAHSKAMAFAKMAQYEYEVEAELIHTFIKYGCRNVAYDPIVAAGQNACILHYTANNQALNKNDLMLIDAGCEFENYAADITRTFPLSGQFSAEQKALYDVVLTAQKKGIEQVKPGLLWHEIQKTLVYHITDGLVALGLLKGNVDSLIERQAYKAFYMHNSGHWLGLDVHDCGAYRKKDAWRPLEKGMVLTVEPGIYVKPELDVHSKWQGIGIRIEDDILVTQNGFENLTKALPVDANDLETIVRG